MADAPTPVSWAEAVEITHAEAERMEQRRQDAVTREAVVEGWIDDAPEPAPVGMDAHSGLNDFARGVAFTRAFPAADATVHLRREDEARVTVDDFGPGSPTVAVMRASYGGQAAALAELGAELERVRAERDRLAEQARGWYDDATRQAAIRDDLYALADKILREVAAAKRMDAYTVERWRADLIAVQDGRDAPAGPLCAPLAAQEPPAGGIGPTEAHRGAEGVACSRPHTMSMPPGRIDFPLRCPECGDLVTIWVGSTAVSARYVPGGPVPPTQWYLVGEGDPVNITAYVDTVSGTSEREGER